MIPISFLQSFGDELKKIASTKKSPVSSTDVGVIKREVEIWNKLRGVSPVTVKEDPEAVLHGGAYFDQQAKEIGLSNKDYESLAHEIGHAELDKKLLGRVLQHPLARDAFRMTPIAGAVAGALMARGKKRALLLPIATILPTLLSESWATRKGSKKLKEIGASGEEIDKYKKNLRDSFVSYFGPPTEGALAGGLTYLAAK